jgi:hypothetical protein
MSVSIATLGMFNPVFGGGGGGATLIREESKPTIHVTKIENIDLDNEIIENKIIVKFIED